MFAVSKRRAKTTDAGQDSKSNDLHEHIELLAARGRELQAQTDLNKAISAFQRATGTTLSANNVDVTDGTNLRISPRRFLIRNFLRAIKLNNIDLYLATD